MCPWGDAMFNELGYNLHLIAFDDDGNLLANVAFPNALDSVCGALAPPRPCSYIGTSLTTHRIIYGDSSSGAPEDMEIWAVVSPFHRLQPLLDPSGRPMAVKVPRGAYVYVYSYPKAVSKVGAPSGPIRVDVYSSQLGTSGPLPAKLYWLDASHQTSVLVYADGSQGASPPAIVGVSDVRKGGTNYCRIIVGLSADSSKSISYFIVAPDAGKVPPFKVEFDSPVAPQYFCGSFDPVLVRIDLPRG